MSESVPSTSASSIPASKKAKPWLRILPFAITAACFAYLYTRLRGAAAAEGSGLLAYLLKSFENVKIHAAFLECERLFVKNILDFLRSRMARLHAEAQRGMA